MILKIPPLAQLSVTGTLGIIVGENGGIYGSVQMGSGGGALLEIPGLISISGDILFQINTTSQAQEVLVVESNQDGEFVGFAMGTVEATTVRFAVSGNLTLLGFITFTGRVDLEIGAGGFDAYMLMLLDIGLVELRVEGAFSIFTLNLVVYGSRWAST